MSGKSGRNPLSSQVISNPRSIIMATRNSKTVVIPYQVRSYQTHVRFRQIPLPVLTVVIPYQVRSYQTGTPDRQDSARHFAGVVIPYQVRSYQTDAFPDCIGSPDAVSRNPLSSQVISNLWPAALIWPCPL